MKALYEAARELIYPGTFSNNHSHQFVMGLGDYPVNLCRALVKFEMRNRGHQDLLGHEALTVHASEKHAGVPARRADKMRTTLGHSLMDLFQVVICERNLPQDAGLNGVLDARDELGYIQALVKFELRSNCETEAFTSKTPFNVVSVRLELDVQPVLLHVRIAVGQKKATRSIPLVSADANTLRGARLLLADAFDKLGGWFRDVSLWPEFRPEGAKPLIEVQGPGMPAPMYLSPAQAEQLNLPQATATAEAPALAAPPPVTAPAETATAPTDADAVLLARLQHDLRGFLDAYSPRTRAFMAQHWEAFRDIANEPGSN